MTTPYIGFDNATLKDKVSVRAGDKIFCDTCKEQHELCAPKDREGNLTEAILFYNCCGKVYLGALAGKLIIHVKADVAGEL